MLEESLPIDFTLSKPPSPLHQVIKVKVSSLQDTATSFPVALLLRTISVSDGGWKKSCPPFFPFSLDFICLAPINKPDTKSVPIVINFDPQLEPV